MATTKQEISEWFDDGLSSGAIAMIVATDTFDWSDYPVYCDDKLSLSQKLNRLYEAEMTLVQEVYDLKKDKKYQMESFRCFEGKKLLENEGEIDNGNPC